MDLGGKKGQSVILLSGRLAELLHLDDREKKQQQQQLRPRAHRKHKGMRISM